MALARHQRPSAVLRALGPPARTGIWRAVGISRAIRPLECPKVPVPEMRSEKLHLLRKGIANRHLLVGTVRERIGLDGGLGGPLARAVEQFLIRRI